MTKRIAFCFDGTWQAPLNNTNITQLFHAIIQSSDQVAYYDDGVGADATGLNRVIEGAFGQGLLQKITDGYTKIAHVCEPGDEIFLFGFSRGAYTARSIAGVIINCGLLHKAPGLPLTVDAIYARYRLGKAATPLYRLIYQQQQPNPPVLSAADQALLQSSRRVPIKMVAVWDTVGALGVPWTEAPLIGRGNFYFHNTNLSVLIEYAYHALAVDENRAPFKPTLWTKFTPNIPEAPNASATPATTAPQTVEQRWFIGAHSNVGGGYVGDQLRNLPLAWLQQKAAEQGLAFTRTITPTGSEYQYKPIDSYAAFMKGLYKFFRLGSRYQRPIGADERPVTNGRSKAINEWIDASVFQRYREFPDYRPQNLSDWATRKGVDLNSQRDTRQA